MSQHTDGQIHTFVYFQNVHVVLVQYSVNLEDLCVLQIILYNDR